MNGSVGRVGREASGGNLVLYGDSSEASTVPHAVGAMRRWTPSTNLAKPRLVAHTIERGMASVATPKAFIARMTASHCLVSSARRFLPLSVKR